MDGSRPLTRMEWIERKLRHAIVTGALRPSEKLNTEALARQWNVSPTPLRETYQALAAEGLIELVPQRGARVAGVSLQDAMEIYEIRFLIEPLALERSLNNRDAEWEKELRAAFSRLQAALRSNPEDLAGFEQAHRDFDEALLSRCGSTWLLRIIGMLRSHSARYRALSTEPKGGGSEILLEHEKLFAACVDGPLDEAVATFRQHLHLTIDSFTRTWMAGHQPDEAMDVRSLRGAQG